MEYVSLHSFEKKLRIQAKLQCFNKYVCKAGMRKWQYILILTASFNLKSPATLFTNTMKSNNPKYCSLKCFEAQQEGSRKSQWEWKLKLN